jgi:hypothetical protein
MFNLLSHNIEESANTYKLNACNNLLIKISKADLSN